MPSAPVIDRRPTPHKYSHASPPFRRPSPPPIATLSAPSTPGSDTSRPRSTSTSYSRNGAVGSSYHPHPYPPPSHHYYHANTMYPSDVYPPPPPPMTFAVGHHGTSAPHPRDSYHPPPPPPHRDYGHGAHGPYPTPGYPMPGHPTQVIFTDDAATKLSDRVRRRCFNCCTTDTSTWRRSNLSPGKVLCNKCGLFERTHSRPRPDQFPHKRGPLAGSTLRSRSPPSMGHTPHLPPPTLQNPSSNAPHLVPHSTPPLTSHHTLPPPSQTLPPPRSLSNSSSTTLTGPQLPPISSNGHVYEKYENGPSESPRLPNIQSWAAEDAKNGVSRVDHVSGGTTAHVRSPILNGHSKRSAQSSPHLSPRLPALKRENERDHEDDRR